MTTALTPIAAATETIAAAAAIIGDIRVSTSVVAPITPPAIVIGPPRANTRGYGGILSAQWNVYVVTAVNQYAVDELLAKVTNVVAAIEKYSPAVCISTGPGTYPNPGGGVLPAYVIVTQMEVTQQ